MEGYDYSWGRPGAAAIAAAGGRFVVRYLTFPGDNGKGLAPSELSELRSAGLDVAVVYQNGKSQALGGHDAGVNDAGTAETALAGLGMHDWPVYFAVDFDASSSQLDVVEDYLRGVASVIDIARTGVYGGYNTINRCYQHGTAKWFWQTYAWSASGPHPAIHLYQYSNDVTLNNAAVDHDRSYQPEFGQHPVTKPPASWWGWFSSGGI